MSSSFSCCLKTFWALFYKEVVAFKSDYWRVTINSLFWTSVVLLPIMLFMPALGLPADYSRFMLAVFPLSWGVFDILANSTSLIGDILGDKTIEHELILPLPQWAVFVKIACANAYRSFSTALLMLPTGALVIYLGKGLVLSHLHIPKFFFILLVANFFYGFLGLFAASFMHKVSDVRNVWIRVMFPMWWMAGFNNNWAVSYKIAPIFSQILLANPMLYVMEGARAAVLGQEGFINYWVCVMVLLGSGAVLGFIGIKRFQKRLDCL